MPREPQPDLRCLPNEQIVDPRDVGAKQVNEWVGQLGISYSVQKFRTVAARMVDLVHGVDTGSGLLPVSDEGIAIDVGTREGTLSFNDVFGSL